MEIFRQGRHMKKIALFFWLLLLPGTNAIAQDKSANIPAAAPREPMLVTVDWLADHLNDASLVLLQISDKKDYESGHIPGAQFLEYASISTPHGQGLMLELPPVEQLVSVFEKLGVSNHSHIILYFGANWVTPTTASTGRSTTWASATALRFSMAAWSPGRKCTILCPPKQSSPQKDRSRPHRAKKSSPTLHG